MSAATHGANMPVQVKLEQQSHQYSSFTMAAAAAAAAVASSNHVAAAAAAGVSAAANPVAGGGMPAAVGAGGSTRTSTSTPHQIHPDIDTQSEAGSERSVTSPFVPGVGNGGNHQPHPHYQSHHQPHLPYHMSHHPLIQHLNEIRGMQDVWYQQHAANAVSGATSGSAHGGGG